MGKSAKKKKYTYAEYLSWDDDGRRELIEGVVYDMSPAPRTTHQEILTEILVQMHNQLGGKKCRAFPAPFDVRLTWHADIPEGDILNVVQPDITVVCDPKKIDERGCIGVPDLLVEILSPSTAAKDLKEKLSLYEKYGVKEYWIVHPEEKILMVYKLDREKKYQRPKIFDASETVKSRAVRGMTIDLGKVFG